MQVTREALEARLETVRNQQHQIAGQLNQAVGAEKALLDILALLDTPEPQEAAPATENMNADQD